MSNKKFYQNDYISLIQIFAINALKRAFNYLIGSVESF